MVASPFAPSIASAAPAAHAAAGRAAAAEPPLSSLQISPRRSRRRPKPHRPFVEYARGGTYVKVKFASRPDDNGTRGDRKAVSEFSKSSRRALERLMAKIDRTAVEPNAFHFVTLTYPKHFPAARASKRDLDNVLKSFERAFGHRAIIWKLEPQKRGAPHYHLVVLHGPHDDAEFQACQTWWAQTWHELVGGGDQNHLKFSRGELRGSRPCVEVVEDWNRLVNYVGKYLGKVAEGGEEWEHPGRYWGVRRRDLLPIHIVKEEVPEAVALKCRRVLVRWYESQPTQWYFMHGKHNRPGRTLRGKDMIDMSGFGEPESIRDCHTKLAEFCEVEITQQRRRWPTSGGGCSMFLPSTDAARLLDWAWSGVEEVKTSGELTISDRFARLGIDPIMRQLLCGFKNFKEAGAWCWKPSQN